jgi:hypothetical protein
LGTRGRHCLPEIVTVGSFLREQGCVMVAAAQPKGHADHHCRQDGPRSRCGGSPMRPPVKTGLATPASMTRWRAAWGRGAAKVRANRAASAASGPSRAPPYRLTSDR